MKDNEHISLVNSGFAIMGKSTPSNPARRIFRKPLAKGNSVASGIAIGVALLTLFLSPTAMAGVDGKYKVRSVTGSITVAGETVNLSPDDVKAIVANKGGNVVVRKKKIPFNTEEANQLVGKAFKKAFKNSGLDIRVKVRGPESLKLRKAGKKYVGKGIKPVVATFAGNVQGLSIDGTLRLKFNPKVKGKTLTFTVPISGSVAGSPIGGNIRIVCKKR